MNVHRSDLEKIKDALDQAVKHHVARDTSNAALHLAVGVRYSPLTSELEAARDRLHALLVESEEA